MTIVSLACLAMASIVFYVGSYHLVAYVRRRSAATYLPFALLCFSVSAYDFFSFGLYNSTSVEQGMFWQRLQLDIAFFISAFVGWFVITYTGGRNRVFLSLVVVSFAVLLALSMVVDPSWTLSADHPSVKHIEFGPFAVTYFEAEIGLLYNLQVALAILFYVYALILLHRHYAHSRDHNALVIITSQYVYFAGVISDSLVMNRVYPFIYVSEYAFLFIVLAMSYVLLTEFVGMYKEVEIARARLEEKVGERTQEIQQLNQELQRLAEVDSLTGAYNRRFLDQYLEIEVRRAANALRHDRDGTDPVVGMNFGLAILDIDNFKRINDTFGHPVGDRVLVQVADLVRQSAFSRDIFCRYGGEEFVLIFTRTSREGIYQAAEKIRHNVEQHPFHLSEQEPAYRMTVSIGAAAFGDTPGRSASDVLRIADQRLLQAKSTGKNKVVFE
jgi:diguanylate cyclase (GGDEF)-like protein